MKTTRLAGAALALLLLAGGTALAKRVTVVPGDEPVTVDIPGSWTVSEIKRGVQAKTADDEVYIWFESYRPAQLQTIIGEHNAYFKEQGVTITGEAKAKQVAFPAYMLKISEYPATYEKKPTVLRYISVVPKSGDLRHLLVSYWPRPRATRNTAARPTRSSTASRRLTTRGDVSSEGVTNPYPSS